MGLTSKMDKTGSAAGAMVLTSGSMEATETWLGTGKTGKQNFQLDRPSHSNNAGLPLAPPAAAQDVVARCAFKGVCQVRIEGVCADTARVYRHSAFTVAFMCLWCLYLWHISMAYFNQKDVLEE